MRRERAWLGDSACGLAGLPGRPAGLVEDGVVGRLLECGIGLGGSARSRFQVAAASVAFASPAAPNEGLALALALALARGVVG